MTPGWDLPCQNKLLTEVGPGDTVKTGLDFSAVGLLIVHFFKSSTDTWIVFLKRNIGKNKYWWWERLRWWFLSLFWLQSGFLWCATCKDSLHGVFLHDAPMSNGSEEKNKSWCPRFLRPALMRGSSSCGRAWYWRRLAVFASPRQQATAVLLPSLWNLTCAAAPGVDINEEGKVFIDWLERLCVCVCVAVCDSQRSREVLYSQGLQGSCLTTGENLCVYCLSAAVAAPRLLDSFPSSESS